MSGKKKFPMSISVDDDIQSKLQSYAALRHMSVSAVISDWVRSLDEKDWHDKDVIKLKDLARVLDYGFCVTVIDLEYVLYKDFGNGYNVEISGLLRKRMPKDVNELMSNIYLWHGIQMPHCHIVAASYHVDFANIVAEVDAMYDYSNKCINDDTIEAYEPLYGMSYPYYGSPAEIRKQIKRDKGRIA